MNFLAFGKAYFLKTGIIEGGEGMELETEYPYMYIYGYVNNSLFSSFVTCFNTAFLRTRNGLETHLRKVPIYVKSRIVTS